MKDIMTSGILALGLLLTLLLAAPILNDVDEKETNLPVALEETVREDIPNLEVTVRREIHTPL